ncbi:imidazole glycerol phosphate synthase subunit HisF [Arcanobacterium wilhelmae]|uniref:Imidazole glycerol phosphate synthase subunit HisF n=1 Tax=Arcanobacterium wilhelmae TaxID=1803177 RepID=A0ABT9N9U8_9ACTO|nr:hypothetical protein [Arcanobacterium wilhelmae]MDP9800280.1 imidazole glycerol phosphate synthase subunit HisF [Arcanobacterium wilhelmae]WFN89717.1 hypothetical protein P8A24_05785 [Arcanobacterium wilhelmae]
MTTATVEVPAEGRAHVTNLEWTAITQDRGAGEHLYVLSDLLDGKARSTLSKATLKARADVTFPVMKGSGPERRTPPTAVAGTPRIERVQ